MEEQTVENGKGEVAEKQSESAWAGELLMGLASGAADFSGARRTLPRAGACEWAACDHRAQVDRISRLVS